MRMVDDRIFVHEKPCVNLILGQKLVAVSRYCMRTFLEYYLMCESDWRWADDSLAIAQVGDKTFLIGFNEPWVETDFEQDYDYEVYFNQVVTDVRQASSPNPYTELDGIPYYAPAQLQPVSVPETMELFSALQEVINNFSSTNKTMSGELPVLLIHPIFMAGDHRGEKSAYDPKKMNVYQGLLSRANLPGYEVTQEGDKLFLIPARVPATV